MFRVVATAVVTAILVSAFWIFGYNIAVAPTAKGPDGKVVAAGDKVVVDQSAAPAVTIAEGVTVGPAGLAIPVSGIRPEQLVDTFTQARAGGARVHDAIDIMAPEGTPVVAATDGVVEKLFLSKGGGITAYLRSPDRRWLFYFAHLQGYAPGLAEGVRVKRGQVIGRVGYTGNANPAGPHLHFAVHRVEPGQSWHEGTAINPYPLLAAKKVRG